MTISKERKIINSLRQKGQSYEPKTPIAEGYYLPNVSGAHKELRAKSIKTDKISPLTSTSIAVTANITMEAGETVDTVDASENFSSYVDDVQYKSCRICCGTATVAALGVASVILPFTYKNATAYRVAITPITHNAGAGIPFELFAKNFLTTGFDIQNDSTAEETVHWIAFGRTAAT